MDFTDLSGNVTELGRFLAEEISVTLASLDKGIEVIDRTHLKVILQEHKLATTGLIDPATARKLGKIAGVESLATGTITPFGDSVRVSVKIIDADTAKIIAASTANIAKTRIIEELVAKGIEPDRPASGKPASSAGSLPSPPATSRFGIAEDSYLRIAVLDFTKSGNVSATVQLEYHNKTDKDININYGGPHAFLVDDLGNNSVGWGSLPGFVLPPRGTKSVGMRFEFRPKKGGRLGNEFTLTVKHTSNPPGQISIANLREK